VSGVAPLTGWLTGHEQLLSALAAVVVIAGVVVSPLGHGLRALFFRSRERLVADPRAATLAPPPPMVTDRPSIAVLPFTNMSDDREQEFLADGMTEDIITGLSLSRSLFVIARNSTFSYKGKSPNVRDVGRELGVRNVLEGSVRRIGENLRVTAQLIDAGTGAHLWAQAFDRPLADIFKMQDEITAGIVAALTSHLRLTVTAEVARARPDSLEAWQLCQRARAQAMASLDVPSRQVAETLLRTAVKKDPGYAPAWGWLAHYISLRWLLEGRTRTAAEQDEALACIERAVALAPTDPDVLALRGGCLTNWGRPKEAVSFLEQAKAINPNEMFYRTRLARALNYSGRPAEALAEIETAFRLNPRDPYAALYALEMAYIQFALRRYEESEAWLRRALANAPRNTNSGILLGLTLAAQDRVEEAHQAVREALRYAPEATLASRESVYRSLGLDESQLADRLKYLAIAWPPELK
jgi:TolB-like protein/Flp pilus assembly protein TadD